MIERAARTTRRLAVVVALIARTASADVGSSSSTEPTRSEPIVVIGSPTPDATDSITLRDRRTIRGRVRLMSRGEFVELTTDSGDNEVFAWAEIVEAQGVSFPGGYHAVVAASAPPASASPVAAPPAIGAEFLQPAPDRVRLVLEGPAVDIGLPQTELYRGSRRIEVRGQHLCFTPCTLYVPPRQTVRLVAHGGRSRVDDLVVRVPRVGTRLLLGVPSPSLTILTPALRVIGGVAVLGGAVALFFGLGTHDAPLDVVGGALVLGGIVGFSTSFVTASRNQVRIEREEPIEVAPERHAMGLSATVRF